MRFRPLSDIPKRFDTDGNRLCRNCENIVAQNRRHYCSERCMLEFNRNNTWFWIRKDVLSRDHYRCGICKQRYRKKELDVDHIVPVRMGIDPYDKDNLRTLCKDCHKRKTKLDHEAIDKNV